MLGTNTTSQIMDEPNPLDKQTEKISEMENLADLASEILGKLEQKKETATAHLGISAAEVETISFDLTALEQSGIFLNIDATGFSVLSRQLDWQSLEIELPKDKHEIVRENKRRRNSANYFLSP